MKTGVPKYIQIYNELKAEILANRFFPDNVFPSEAELMSRFQASRTTIRHVMAQLTEDKLIEVGRGKRGRVCSKNLSNASYTFLQRNGNTNIAKRFKTSGPNEISSQAIVVDTIPADPEVAAALAISVGETVYRLQRVKLVDNVIFSYITSYIHPDLVPGLDKFSGQFHYLFGFLEQKYGIVPEWEQQVVSPGVIGFLESRILNAELGEQLLVHKKTVWSQNRPIEYSVTLDRSNIVEYFIEGPSPTKPAYKTALISAPEQ